MKVPTAVVLSLAAALIAAGCGGSAPTQPVDANQVEMAKSYRFSPALIRVAAGTTVTWRNDDNFTHDVHLLDGSNWRSQPLPPGGSTTYTFSAPGEHPYECGFHPQDMKGKVIVVAPS